MLTDLSASLIVLFLLTVGLTFILFVNVTRRKATVAIILLLWLAITGILSFKKVFQDAKAMPPRLMLVIALALVVIILSLVTKNGRKFTDSLDLRKLTLVHIVRIPVEITLYLLAANKLIPELMTFTGRNFDILSGITAPFFYFICFRNTQLKNRGPLLAWNFICLALLLNIVINAVLSAPFPFQQFAFDQPNIAILYFPFTWLPCFIVVIVLYCHLAAIRQLIRYKKQNH
jgi:hypothetical protein